jgi:hypothetical protein
MRAIIGSGGQLDDERRGQWSNSEDPRQIAEGPPSFKVRQNIFNHVARQVHDDTDNHQRERESHP